MHRFSRPLKTGTLFLSVWLATGILFGLSTNAVGPVILFIGLAVAWREGDHDDLVLAVAMTCWGAVRGANPGGLI